MVILSKQSGWTVSVAVDLIFQFDGLFWASFYWYMSLDPTDQPLKLSPTYHPGHYSPGLTSLSDHPSHSLINSFSFTCSLNWQWVPPSSTPFLALFCQWGDIVLCHNFSCYPYAPDSRSIFTTLTSTLHLYFQLEIFVISPWIPFKNLISTNKNQTYYAPNPPKEWIK